MSGFDTSSTLTYSTLHTTSLGVGSYNTPLQRSLGCSFSPYNVVPYGWGHIPPLSPSIFNNHLGPMLVLSYLAEGFKGLIPIQIWLGPCLSLYLVLLGIRPSLRQRFHQGGTHFSINPTLCKVLYLDKELW
jgi:hypothetical protein